MIRCVRDRFLERGFVRRSRKLSSALKARFRQQGGKQCLYRLFHCGRVLNACRLAGVPLPQNCVDPRSGPLSNALEAILQRVAENHRESNEHVPSASRGSRRRILTRWTSVYLQ